MRTTYGRSDIDRICLIQEVNNLRAKQGKTIQDACKAVGIEQNLYYTWRKKLAATLETVPEPAEVAESAVASAPIPKPIKSNGNVGGYLKQSPDLAFLDFRRGSPSSIRDQLGQVARERDELRRILIGIVSGRISPSELLEGMFNSHLEDRVRALEGGDS
jgi:hypothetical protein